MRDIYSVSAVNQYIKELIGSDYALNHIYVRGEISNCKYHSSGHIYFTLKDRGGAFACVMFAGQRRGLQFVLKEGMQVIVLGSIGVYERDGKYQLYASEIVKEGTGYLYEQYERLKKKLEAEGLFDRSIKKPLPVFPKKLGIVTASTGAAIQDMIHVSLRRNPYLQLVFYPAKVQGEGAAGTIVQGIRALDKYGVDVIIIGRGGGSIEDLWAFNEEIVARAIYECRTPLISAVGHETDFTIADFAADLRAPTPSAAAELAVPDVLAVLEKIRDYEARLDYSFRGSLTAARVRVSHMESALGHLSPRQQLIQKRQDTMHYESRLEELMLQKMTAVKHRMALDAQRLKGVSPLEKLGGGYAYVSREGSPVKSVNDVAKNDILEITVADGSIRARAEQTFQTEKISDTSGKNEKQSADLKE